MTKDQTHSSSLFHDTLYTKSSASTVRSHLLFPEKNHPQKQARNHSDKPSQQPYTLSQPETFYSHIFYYQVLLAPSPQPLNFHSNYSLHIRHYSMAHSSHNYMILPAKTSRPDSMETPWRPFYIIQLLCLLLWWLYSLKMIIVFSKTIHSGHLRS